VKVFEAMKEIFIDIFEEWGIDGFFTTELERKGFEFGGLVMFGDDSFDEFIDHFKGDD